jgi:DNA polymerase V
MDLFQDFLVEEKQEEKEQKMDPELESDKERRVQNAILEIQKRYGKNALLKGMNLEEGAMTRERNNQIGGHKA